MAPFWNPGLNVSRTTMMSLVFVIAIAQGFNWWSIRSSADAQNEAYIHLVKQNQEMLDKMKGLEDQSNWRSFEQTLLKWDIEDTLQDFTAKGEARFRKNSQLVARSEATEQAIDTRLTQFMDGISPMLKKITPLKNFSKSFSTLAREL